MHLKLYLNGGYSVTKNTELRELQDKSLEILLVFKDFCEKNKLLFYFCGGCCIGTLRHGGFIPWDDDIDVFMPRNDYEKLSKIWPVQMKNTKYSINRDSKDLFLRSLLTAISDEETTFIKERQSDLDISHGIRLEILPLDGCPSSGIKRKIQIFWAFMHQILMNQEAPTSKGKLFEFIGRVILFIFPTWKSRYRMGKYAEKKMSKYPIEECTHITELCARWKYMVNEYPKEIFEEAIYKDFEGFKMPIPVGYDTYLHMAFGDYMILPPKEDQIPKHDAVFIDMKNSYKKYRGKYYLV